MIKKDIKSNKLYLKNKFKTFIKHKTLYKWVKKISYYIAPTQVTKVTNFFY